MPHPSQDPDQMKIEITVVDDRFEGFTPRTYSAEEDDIRSILIDVCRHTKNNVDFNVSGFGQGRWPVDSGTDLPVFLEQLPGALKSIRARRSSDIDFYEQGIEMTLQFTPSEADDFYTVRCVHNAHCTHNATQEPTPDAQRMPASDLLRMMSGARDTFVEILLKTSPMLIRHPWVTEWKNT